MGPGQSMDGASGITPSRGRRPVVGLSPKVPHIDAGMRIDPPVSEPSAQGTMPAATAAADPPLEPPVNRATSQGLPVRPQADTRLVPPAARSCWLGLPTTTTPAERTRET